MGKIEHTSSETPQSEARSSTFGSRLREERERLGLTQEQLAKAGGVHRRTQVNYESDERSPGAAYINSIAREGVDTWYVLQGVRGTFMEFLNSWAAAFIFELLAKLGYGPDQVPEILIRAEKLHQTIAAAARASENSIVESPTAWEKFNDQVFDEGPTIIALRRRAELDVPRVQAVLAFIDGESAATGVDLPTGKRAQLAASLYRNAFSDGDLNASLARDLFRLSAPEA